MRALIFGMLPVTLACGGPSVGEIAQGQVTLTLSAQASEPNVAAVGDAHGGLGVTRAFVSASALSLVPCLPDASSIVLDARGYDLLDSPSEAVSTAVTQLCAVQLDLDPVDGAATPGVPDGATLYVEALDAAGNELSFTSTRSKSLRFVASSDAGFASASLLLGFDVSLWLTGLPLSEPDTADAEAELFDSQLRSAVALYADTNENQVLDADEATPIAIAAPAR